MAQLGSTDCDRGWGLMGVQGLPRCRVSHDGEKTGAW